MRRQQGSEQSTRRDGHPVMMAGPRERGEDGEDLDPESGEGFEMEYEDDRFSTNHDDRAGRRWRIQSGLDEGEREDRGNGPADRDDGGEEPRGVFHVRATSTTPQDRDARGRFTAEEPPTWMRENRWRRDDRRDRRPSGPPRYDDGIRASTERRSRGRQAGSRAEIERSRSSYADEEGPGRRGRDERDLPFANDAYRGREREHGRHVSQSRDEHDLPFANDAYRAADTRWRHGVRDSGYRDDERGSMRGRDMWFDPEPRFDEWRHRGAHRDDDDRVRFDGGRGMRFDREPRSDEWRRRPDDRRRDDDDRGHMRARDMRFDQEPHFDERRYRGEHREDCHRHDDRRMRARDMRFDQEPRFDEWRDRHRDDELRSNDRGRMRDRDMRFDQEPRFDEWRNRHRDDDRDRMRERDMRFDQERRARHWTDEPRRHSPSAPPDELGYRRGSPPRRSD